MQCCLKIKYARNVLLLLVVGINHAYVFSLKIVDYKKIREQETASQHEHAAGKF
jgi:hypothetical protein